jgi:hypothetical protein
MAKIYLDKSHVSCLEYVAELLVALIVSSNTFYQATNSTIVK